MGFKEIPSFKETSTQGRYSFPIQKRKTYFSTSYGSRYDSAEGSIYDIEPGIVGLTFLRQVEVDRIQCSETLSLLKTLKEIVGFGGTGL